MAVKVAEIAKAFGVSRKTVYAWESKKKLQSRALSDILAMHRELVWKEFSQWATEQLKEYPGTDFEK